MQKNRLYNFIGVFILIILVNSCATLNKSRMLKTPLNYEFDKVVDSLRYEEYRVTIDDEIMFNMYNNNGYSFISLGTGGAGVALSSAQGSSSGGGGGGMAMGGGMGMGMRYKVRPDSTIKVPLIGYIQVVGLTMGELENLMEEKLSHHYKDPFVIARIENKRIFVFNSGNAATIYQLQNQNTTLFEVLAATGGVPANSNASRIKVIRGNAKNPEIYLIDLSTIDGISDAKMIMQAGDIVYIDPFINYANFIVTDIGGVMGLLSSVIIVYSLFLGRNTRL
jgi:polysaccharide export outer membrane protein